MSRKARKSNQENSGQYVLLLNRIIRNQRRTSSFRHLKDKYNIEDIIESHEQFSRDKTLYNFQMDALSYAVDGILVYYHLFNSYDGFDYSSYYWNHNIILPDGREIVSVLKNTLYDKYHEEAQIVGLDKNYFPPSYTNVDKEIIKWFYPDDNNKQEERVIDFRDFVNVSSLWMATGSGKTLVIVALIDILFQLMKEGIIPTKPVLFLTARADLLEHFKIHVHDSYYNFHIKSLKEIHSSHIPLITDRTVFTYRADLISNQQKDALLDYRNYLMGGNWYIILDEAHKGKDDSEIKHRILAMAKNGFIFNFSATFTEPAELVTTGFKYNLEEFISAGRGKNIVVCNDKIREYDTTAILKSLLLLSVIRDIAREQIGDNATLQEVMHSPLGVYVVRTVSSNASKNTVEELKSDMDQLIGVLVSIARGEIGEDVLLNAAREIVDEGFFDPIFTFEDSEKVGKFKKKLIVDIIREIVSLDNVDRLKYLLYKNIFGTNSVTDIRFSITNQDDEILLKNHNEEAFALIRVSKINDIKSYLIQNGIVETSTVSDRIFNHLDRYPNISILLGSRKFYEGWDSPRPNTITFINLGTNDSNTKFVLQTIGRGVRVRWRNEYGQHVQHGHFVNKKQLLMETAFIFATKPDIMEKILKGIRTEKGGVVTKPVDKIKYNNEIEKLNIPLIIPKIRKSISTLALDNENISINIRIPKGYDVLVRSVTDGKLLNMLLPVVSTYDIEEKAIYELIQYIREHLKTVPCKEARKMEECFKEMLFKSVRNLLNHSLLVSNSVDAISFFDISKRNSEHIIHYRHMQVVGRDEKVVANVYDRLSDAIDKGKSRYSIKQYDIYIQSLAKHFYIPIVQSDNEKEIYIKHSITVESEKVFLEDLLNDLEYLDNAFGGKWVFSKIDETLDRVSIPYVDKHGNLRQYYPDFIFWTVKDNTLVVTLVDPKSPNFADAEPKIMGIYEIFGKKVLNYGQYKVGLIALYYDADTDLDEPYAQKHHYVDNIEDLVKRIEEAHEKLKVNTL